MTFATARELIEHDVVEACYTSENVFRRFNFKKKKKEKSKTEIVKNAFVTRNPDSVSTFNNSGDERERRLERKRVYRFYRTRRRRPPHPLSEAARN